MFLKKLLTATALTATCTLTCNFASAAPITYDISAEVSSVWGGGILGHAAAVGDALTGTAVFDADQANPWGAVTFEINGNTFELLTGATRYVTTNPGQYVLGYDVGTWNPGNDAQWRVNGVDTVIATGGSGAYFTLIFGESDSNAPNAPTLRSPDSPLWDDFNIQMDFGFSGAVFNNESITQASVPAPATAGLLLIAICAMRRRS